VSCASISAVEEIITGLITSALEYIIHKKFTTQNNVHWRVSSVICVRLSLAVAEVLPLNVELHCISRRCLLECGLRSHGQDISLRIT